MNIFKPHQLRAVPYVRFITKAKKNSKIKVQLLKDFKNFGKKGEIITVLPSVMRNILHPYNGAHYILRGQGPKIPVYERPDPNAQAQAEEESKKVNTSGTESDILKQRAEMLKALEDAKDDTAEAVTPGKPLGLEFPSSPETTSTPTAPTYSLFKIDQSLKKLTFANQEVTEASTLAIPITLQSISDEILSQTGETVPVSDITLKTSKTNQTLDEIKALGSYRVTIQRQDVSDRVERSVVVE